MPRSWEDLFWACLMIVAGAVVVFAARGLFCGPKPRRARWLPVIAGLVLMVPACSERPLPRFTTPTGSGWSSPHMPIDHYPPTGRDDLQRT